MADGAEFVRRAAAWLIEGIKRAAAARGHCAVALAGGRTPEPIYEALASPGYEGRVPWAHVDVFFTDERAVAADDPDSNYRMVRRALLDRVGIEDAQVHRMEADRADVDAAARDYEALLPPRLDVLLLGMGQDGHTASLFPRNAAMAERERRVVSVQGPKPPALRLTITPPVVALARRVALVATGADKADVAAQALEGPFTPEELPVQLALRGTWFLDHAAAAKLNRS